MGDLKFAYRQLRKHPAFTAAAILTLALGIGATTAMFTVVNGILLKPLPYDDAGQLVQVWESPGPGRENNVSLGVFADWAQGATRFEALAATSNVALNLTGVGEPERVDGVAITAKGLQVLRARPLLGRLFTAAEHEPGRGQVVVLTERLWRRRFASDPDVLGRAVSLSGEPFTVIGVLPRSFLPSDRPEFVIPFAIDPERREVRTNHFLEVVGRLRPGVTLEQGRTDLERAALPFKAQRPAYKREWGAAIVPLHQQLTGRVRPALLTLLGAVGLVLLIACANVANLQLARAAARQREIAVRMALGASRKRVVRQLLTESLLLALAGGGLGVAAAVAGVGLLRRWAPETLPRLQQIGVDWQVLAFALAVTIATGVAFGLAPALPASRPDLNRALNELGRGGISGRSRTRELLIVSEMAVALVLLVGAGLLLNSFVRLASVSPGFDPSGVLTFQLALPDGRYPDSGRRTAMFGGVLERIAGLPGVTDVGVTASLPLSGGPSDTFMTIAGRQDQPAEGYDFDYTFVSPGYFRALAVPLLRGRLIERADDTATSPRVAVVSEGLARAFFAGEDPLGRHLVHNGKEWEIVGIVGDVQMRALGGRVPPLVYLPFTFSPNLKGTIVVRASVSPASLAEPVRRAVLALDAEQPLANVRSLSEIVSRSLTQRRLVLRLLSGFALSALLLAALGLYGVMAYAVTQRTREIGIRSALGARREDVLAMVVGQGVSLAGAGAGLGIAGALALTRVLTGQLYGVEATDPATFAGVTVLLLLVAVVAAWFPAHRASRIDPMTALREP
jgi:predicted permease